MRSPANSLPAELRRTAHEAREAKAAELYGLDALRQGMTKAAGRGVDYHTVTSPDGLDLRATVAAVAAVAWLKDQGIVNQWEARAGGVGADGATAWTLTLSWAKSAAAE